MKKLKINPNCKKKKQETCYWKNNKKMCYCKNPKNCKLK